MEKPIDPKEYPNIYLDKMANRSYLLTTAIKQISSQTFSEETKYALLFVARYNLVGNVLETMGLRDITIHYKNAYRFLYFLGRYRSKTNLSSLYAFYVKSLKDKSDFTTIMYDEFKKKYPEIPIISYSDVLFGVLNDEYLVRSRPNYEYTTHPYNAMSLALYQKRDGEYNAPFELFSQYHGKYDDKPIFYTEQNYDNISLYNDKLGILDFYNQTVEIQSDLKESDIYRYDCIFNRDKEKLPRLFVPGRDSYFVWLENWLYFTDRELVKLYGTYKSNYIVINTSTEYSQRHDSIMNELYAIRHTENSVVKFVRKIPNNITLFFCFYTTSGQLNGKYFKFSLTRNIKGLIASISEIINLKDETGKKLSFNDFEHLNLDINNMTFNTYRNGILHGNFEEYSRNKINKGNYNDGHLHGIYETIYKNTNEKTLRYFFHGREISHNEYTFHFKIDIAKKEYLNKYLLRSEISDIVSEYIE